MPRMWLRLVCFVLQSLQSMLLIGLDMGMLGMMGYLGYIWHMADYEYLKLW